MESGCYISLIFMIAITRPSKNRVSVHSRAKQDMSPHKRLESREWATVIQKAGRAKRVRREEVQETSYTHRGYNVKIWNTSDGNLFSDAGATK